MLDFLQLKHVWSIIEQEKIDVSQKTSDSEVIQQLLDKLRLQTSLSTAEEFDIHLYIQSRISLIRDLAEIQAVEIVGK